MDKFSKGAWGFEVYSSHGDIVIGADGWDIANMVNPCIYPTEEFLDEETKPPDQETQFANAKLMSRAPLLLNVARSALADLEGIMPDFEPSGDRTHPAWQTIIELRAAIRSATEGE